VSAVVAVQRLWAVARGCIHAARTASIGINSNFKHGRQRLSTHTVRHLSLRKFQNLTTEKWWKNSDHKRTSVNIDASFWMTPATLSTKVRA
jgi:hypothetical protein